GGCQRANVGDFEEIRFSRIWAMPNKNTFDVKPIADLIGGYVRIGERWFDPFARNSRFNKLMAFTNDLSPDADTTHHMEALDFINQLEGEFDGALFDPPYSPRQISESYQAVGRSVHMKDTQSSFYGDRKAALAKKIRVGGTVISCGWNSGGIGKKNGFEVVEVLLVPHGGAHNDTIVTVERKVRPCAHATA